MFLQYHNLANWKHLQIKKKKDFHGGNSQLLKVDAHFMIRTEPVSNCLTIPFQCTNMTVIWHLLIKTEAFKRLKPRVHIFTGSFAYKHFSHRSVSSITVFLQFPDVQHHHLTPHEQTLGANKKTCSTTFSMRCEPCSDGLNWRSVLFFLFLFFLIRYICP